MTNATTNEKLNCKPRSEFLDIFLKVLMWIGIIVGAAVILVLLYKVLQYLFVGALLFVAWLCPKRWW